MGRDPQELAIDFLAFGLDPEHSVLFRQSDVPGLNELGEFAIIERLPPSIERIPVDRSSKRSTGVGATAAQSFALLQPCGNGLFSRICG